ncbi:MAG: MobF family relaxase [Bryobacteraceae bacterium]
MLTIRALTGGATYASRHLSSNDYYSEKERVIGQWMGQGAQRLGLEGPVEMDQFDAIRQVLDPATGEFLRPRQSADRFNEDGERTGTARSLYDFTVSAPKSVSIQSMLDPRLLESHNQAVIEMAHEMERLAATRLRQHGADENRGTGNLVIAAYQHDTSRELDPQIHTHLVAANLTYDSAESRWKALQASDIYEQRAYLTEVYRNALARSVTELGYPIVDRFDNGRERGFEIEGIAAETIDKFSQRSEQRDQAINGFVAENGRVPTNREIAVLVRESREDKLAEISTAEVKQKQWERFTPNELSRLRELLTKTHQERQPEQEQRQEQVVADASLVYAREHLFERMSVAKDHELKLEALRHGRGRIGLDELKAAVLGEEQRGVLLKVGNEVATHESVARERAMIETIHRGQGQFSRLGGGQEFVVSDRLRPEQKHAVEVVLDSRDLAVNLRGAAGTGKTATLQEIQRALAEAGREVIAVAPTRSAVEELEKIGFARALTVERLLQDSSKQKQLAGNVLIVDEAGMVSSRQMSELLALAERSRIQILFSGDTRQLQSVEAGDALRVLEQESRLKSVSLIQVQRQTLAEYRTAVEELRQNPARGFRQLEQMGAVREIDWQLRPQEVSQAYLDAIAQPNAKGQTREVLVVAPTHDEIRRLTEAIRHDRKRAGDLGESAPLTRYVPLNWTEVQKQHTKHYQPGLVLAFHKATKDVAKHEAVEVVRVEKDKLFARKETGQEITLTRRQVQAFSVHERQDIDVAAGDKLMLQANRRETGFRATNGEIVTVARLEDGRIQLEDGRLLPANYHSFDHGYVITAHRSQGKTVDAVIVSGDRMSKEQFYVAVSRGRESLTIITSDKQQLQESIGVSGERLSASELARKTEGDVSRHQLPERTQERNLEAAGTWALRQSASRAADEQRNEQHGVERGRTTNSQRSKEPTPGKEIDHGFGQGF